MKLAIAFLGLLLMSVATSAQTVINTSNGMVVVSGKDTLFLSKEMVTSGKDEYARNRDSLSKNLWWVSKIKVESPLSEEYKAAYKKELVQQLVKRAVGIMISSLDGDLTRPRSSSVELISSRILDPKPSDILFQQRSYVPRHRRR